MAQSVTPVSLQFQDINEWVRQQDELDVEKAANDKLATERKENLKPAPISPLTKKVKPLPDIESLAAEKLAMEEMGDENWIGKLQQYRDVHPIAGGGITWVEKEAASQLIPRFRCAVLISESAQHFGSTTLGLDSTHVVSFGNKKTAKKYAAKKAVEWLIENNHMPSNGSVKFPKVVTPIPTRPISPKEEGAASYSSQVPELCYRLGFTTPSYVITAAVEHSPMWNCYADFGSDPRIEGKVGEVQNVYGKKNAKEAVAKLVLSFLRDIERQRRAEFDEDDDDEDKKRKRSESESPEKHATKTAKVDAEA